MISDKALQYAREYHCRYCAGGGYRCPEDLEGNAEEIDGLLDCLAICEEIAADSRVDLVDSERRIRLYAAITKAGGKL
jgi:hypothetical protein